MHELSMLEARMRTSFRQSSRSLRCIGFISSSLSAYLQGIISTWGRTPSMWLRRFEPAGSRRTRELRVRG